MGYCEVHCQLCAVSFAIARIRRHGEPKEAAWDYTGTEFVDTDTYTPPSGDCGEESGCETLNTNGDDLGDSEHVAGPNCVATAGYSGHRISVEEMKGCRAVQCLTKKGKGWKPEPDDQDFELESKYFLTGFGDGSPDEAPLEPIKPARHGVESVYITNSNDYIEEVSVISPAFNFLENGLTLFVQDQSDGLPFHPTCFKIFKQVSKLQLGNVDVEGLWFWRDLDDFYSNCPADEPTQAGKEQWWLHEVGNEYLVANPIEVPGLSNLLKPQNYRTDAKATFGWGSQGPGDTATENYSIPPRRLDQTSDLLSSLPAEISGLVLEYLGSKDIANLRLASPLFRQLPTILFRRLLLEDMPWMWEVKDFPTGEMDWHRLYLTMKTASVELKGLRNRERVWIYVEEVMRRIRNFREEGKIPA